VRPLQSQQPLQPPPPRRRRRGSQKHGLSLVGAAGFPQQQQVSYAAA
jgi:hypothetical protein